MPEIVLFSSTYDREAVGLPVARLQNVYVEATGAGPTKQAFLPRPQLKSAYSVGSGPVRKLYQSDGVFGGDIFAVSGGQFYRNTTLIGSVANDHARIAASPSQVVVVCQGVARVYNGTTFVALTTFKDGTSALPAFSDVAYSAGRFIYTVDGSDRFYWSDLSDATKIDGLSFATAERAPDVLVGVEVLNEEVFLFGSASVEMWLPSGDPDQPYTPTLMRMFTKGAVTIKTVAHLDNTLFWVGNDLVVYRAADRPVRISTHGIEEKLQQSGNMADANCFVFTLAGHAFYVLHVPNVGTYAYDVSRPDAEWVEWTSYGRAAFRGLSGIRASTKCYLGDDASGAIFTLEETPEENPLPKIVPGFIPMKAGVSRCDVIHLKCVMGVGQPMTAATVDLRWSDDAGRSWTPWKTTSLGAEGQYQRRATWRMLGMMRAPGRYLEFRCSDPVQFAIEGANFNEARP